MVSEAADQGAQESKQSEADFELGFDLRIVGVVIYRVQDFGKTAARRVVNANSVHVQESESDTLRTPSGLRTR